MSDVPCHNQTTLLCAAGYKQSGVVKHCETMVPYVRRGVEEHHGYVDQPGIEQYWMIVPNQIRSNCGDRYAIYGGCVNKPRKGQGELICLGLRNLGKILVWLAVKYVGS